ncbi:MBL fold metallo-hydrolase [uncultured Helicobacter sp.]|uniref:ComEC/Rec2 family competence protein n=1 Tax=uncultured Helicobacter sp. TaxID=175537 RepID=UPI002618D8E6|nr:MBL fold metallo-hydrolase [uncultured Helicobacter sp.]
MNYEIDFLPVGNGNNSGDAIALRWWQGDWGRNKQKVMIIDGGTKESGGALVKHIQKYYKTDCVDYVVNTHPDKDHASGLTEILENLKVKELWIHRPWCYIDQIIKFIDNPSNNFKRDKRTTTDSMRERFEQKYYQYARKLETIATQKEIEIKEPYEGCQIGVFQVLSPNKDWHLYDLIPNSNKTKEISIEDSKQTSILESMREVCINVAENMNIETLKEYNKEKGKTSEENESSVILYANLDGRGILLTGDAGNEALQNAHNYALSQNINISKSLSFIQIPHHGSRRNVSPSILNKFIGNKNTNKKNSIVAFVSAGKDDDRHPRRVVINAFIRRGCKVIATQGSTKRHRNGNVPQREGWITAEPLPFYDKVESYE